MELVDLVDLRLGLSWKRHCPSGFMDCLDFHTVTAVIEATASFRHFRLTLHRAFSERILSESFVLVINYQINVGLRLLIFELFSQAYALIK